MEFTLVFMVVLCSVMWVFNHLLFDTAYLCKRARYQISE